MHAKASLSLVAITLLLLACDRGTGRGDKAATSQSEAPVAVEPAGEAVAVPAGPAPKGLSAVPDSIRTCDVRQGMTALLRWDVTDMDASRVVLSVMNPKLGVEKPFGRGGPLGSKQTGPWLRPGLVFKLSDEATGVELDSVTISGIPCN